MPIGIFGCIAESGIRCSCDLRAIEKCNKQYSTDGVANRGGHQKAGIINTMIAMSQPEESALSSSSAGMCPRS